ncbi:Adenine deaminase [Caloramator mitchellensis]|uniref:Adenine deaminase n=1 Tax=Caloramator mitchellensis TaxID=908809 RepID=A0A0R3K3F3_CALMK|nr:adenine deaminase [Caloramator mitchellensis]KRQ87573.1 Adenine deaminase [Caloramator mitchellensis]
MDELKKFVNIARGKQKAELVIKNCRIINVFSHEIIEGDIAIEDGKIVAVGDYEGLNELDAKGLYAAPGLIDAHVHIESSLVTPGEFAKAIVPRGTTSIIADPHEIANVCGIDGIEYMLKASEKLPLDVFLMFPSCVPATDFETSGATLTDEDIKSLIDNQRILGLGELMDFPSVINAEEKILKKIEASKGKIIDGHGPSIIGKDLNAYAAAKVRTEHECSTVNELVERLRLGIYILIREGSAARNLAELAKAVNPYNLRRCLFCTDDRHPEDIINFGHINNNLKIAVKNGIDAISAITMATLNAAECYGLKDKGAIAPNFDADIVLFKDLVNFEAIYVFKNGKLVAKDGNALFEAPKHYDERVLNRINIKNINYDTLKIMLREEVASVIKLMPFSLVTKNNKRRINLIDGEFRCENNENLLKLAVIERHRGTGNVGLGIVEGFGLKNGAIATTIAHDSHNLIVIGDNDEDMIKAVKEIEKVKGGITVVSRGEVLNTLPLPIAGLMSDEDIETVNRKLTEIIELAYERLNVSKDYDPVMTLAFLALPVIPELKLTDKGLFNVMNFTFEV